MPAVVVRPVVRADIERILEMDPSALAEARHALVQSAVGRSECLVAVESGTVVGYGVMNHQFFERGFVSLIYVETTQRRRRVSSSFFDEFERKSDRLFTSANISNLPMQQFLVSRGYVLSGVVQDLDKDDPEIFYSKKVR